MANWNRPGAIFVAAPSTVQLVSGKVRSVLDNTVRDALRVLQQENWKTPWHAMVAPVSTGNGVVPLLLGGDGGRYVTAASSKNRAWTFASAPPVASAHSVASPLNRN